MVVDQLVVVATVGEAVDVETVDIERCHVANQRVAVAAHRKPVAFRLLWIPGLVRRVSRFNSLNSHTIDSDLHCESAPGRVNDRVRALIGLSNRQVVRRDRDRFVGTGVHSDMVTRFGRGDSLMDLRVKVVARGVGCRVANVHHKRRE